MSRICFLAHKYYPQHPYICRDAETLADAGYDVDVICLRHKGEKGVETLRRINIYRIPLEHHRGGISRYLFEYPTFFLLASWLLALLHLRKKYKVIEVHTMPDFLIFATLLPKLMGTKIILNVLDHMPEAFAEKFKVSPNHFTVKLIRLIERASLRWADHVIAPDGVHQRDILQRRGVPSNKISEVLNVPDERVFGCRSSAYHEHSHFQVITHGSLLEWYGIQTLIGAIPLLTREIPQLEVKIVGDGEYRPQLEKLAQSLEVDDHVEFTGWVEFKDVPTLINGADVGVVAVTAKGNPTMPCKLLEYLALGKPTVVSALESIRAYLDNNSVMFFEPGSERDLARCLLELYRDPIRRASLAEGASAIYEKYRWSNSKNQYLKIYRDLIREDSGTGVAASQLPI
jgi:glycosyltransferase involved in cell wall biosynthesis